MWNGEIDVVPPLKAFEFLLNGLQLFQTNPIWLIANSALATYWAF